MLTQKKVRTLVLLGALEFLVATGITLIYPVLTKFAEAFTASYSLIGVAIAMYAISRVFLDVPAGILTDRFGRRNTLVLGLVLLGAGPFLSGLSSTFEQLLLFRALEGMGSAFIQTMTVTLAVEMSGTRERGKIVGIYGVAMILGATVGPVVGGFSAEMWGLRAPFFMYAVFAMAAIPVAWRLTNGGEMASAHDRSRGYKKMEFSRAFNSILRNRTFLLVWAATLCIYFSKIGLRVGLIPIYSYGFLGLTESEVGLVTAIISLFTLFLLFPSGVMLDRYGRRVVTVLGSLIMSLSTVLFLYANNFAHLAVIAIVFGSGVGLSWLLGAYAADWAPSEYMGTAMGVHRMSIDLGHILGPILLGLIADIFHELTTSFYVAALVLIAAGIFLLMGKEVGRDRSIIVGSQH